MQQNIWQMLLPKLQHLESTTRTLSLVKSNGAEEKPNQKRHMESEGELFVDLNKSFGHLYSKRTRPINDPIVKVT